MNRLLLSLASGVTAILLTLDDVDAAARLELSLVSPRESFPLGEPPPSRAQLANRGDEPANVLRHLRPEYGAVVYEITGPVSRRYTPWALKDPADAFATLAPGESIEQDVDLFFDAQGWVFREPGDYRVIATYADGIVAEPFPLTIRPPADGAERAAADQLLGSEQAGRFLLLRGGDHLREGMDVLANVARDQAQTPHAAYADQALGINLLTPARDFAAGTVRQADPRAAAERLDRAQDRALPFERTVETQVGLATALRALGQDARAAEIEARLPSLVVQRFPTVDPGTLERVTLPSVRARIRQP